MLKWSERIPNQIDLAGVPPARRQSAGHVRERNTQRVRAGTPRVKACHCGAPYWQIESAGDGVAPGRLRHKRRFVLISAYLLLNSFSSVKSHFSLLSLCQCRPPPKSTLSSKATAS